MLFSHIPNQILRDCSAWASLGYPSTYDGKGTCLWWLRLYDNLRPAITDSSKRGLVERGSLGTRYAKVK